MIKNDSLHDVEISDFNSIEETVIIADNPINRQFKFQVFILFFLFFITIFVSFSNSLQHYFQIKSDDYDITSSGKIWTYHLNPKISNIFPQMSSFLLTLVLSTQFSKDDNANPKSNTDIFNDNHFLKFKPFLSCSVHLFKNGQQLKFINMTILDGKIIDKIKNGNQNSQLNNIFYLTKDKIHFVFDIFYSESIVFDEIQVNVDVYGKVSKNEKIIMISKSKNPRISFIISIFRAVCSLMLAYEIIYSCFYLNRYISFIISNKKYQRKTGNANKKEPNLLQTINIEILLTSILTILCLFYVDPFLLVHYFKPSSFYLSFKVAFRDIFFSYLFFYMIVIFDYFEKRNKIHSENSNIKDGPDEEDERYFCNKMVIAFVFSFFIFIFLFVQNTKVQTIFSVFPKIPFLKPKSNYLYTNYNANINSSSISEIEFESEFGRVISRLNVEYDSLNICHFILLAFCVVSIPFKMITSYSNVKKMITSNRYVYYSVTSLTFLILLVFYTLIKLRYFTSSSRTIPVDHFYSQNTRKLIGRNKNTKNDDGEYCFVNESFFCCVFPMVLFTLYVTIMAIGHHDSENIFMQPDTYVSPDFKENNLDVDIDETKDLSKNNY